MVALNAISSSRSSRSPVAAQLSSACRKKRGAAPAFTSVAAIGVINSWASLRCSAVGGGATAAPAAVAVAAAASAAAALPSALFGAALTARNDCGV